MAFQSGIPANTATLIQIFIDWLVSNAGFTLANTWTYTANTEFAESTGSTSFTARALSRDSQYIYLSWKTSSPTYLLMNIGTNNPSANRINAQTGCDTTNNMVIEIGSTPLKYWMFADGFSAHCAIEWKGGAYQHISAGYLEKYGSWSGGTYVGGIYNSRRINTGISYVDHDYSWHHVTFGDNNGYDAARSKFRVQSSVRYVGGVANTLSINCKNINNIITDYQPNAYNGRSVLLPVDVGYISVVSGSELQIRPVGKVSNCAMLSLNNLNPGDTVLNDWLVFPWSAKNAGGTTADGYVNSLNYGIAYKK